MKVVVTGSGGRMGRAVIEAVEADPSLSLAASLDIGMDLAPIGAADVLIDFTLASAFDGMLRAAMQASVAVVSGTTRLSPESLKLIDRAAEKIAVLWAPNMSVGVHVVGDLVERAVRALGRDYDIEIVEAHHNKKVDAPSGTAVYLREAAEAARPGLRTVAGREGQPGARDPDEIGMFASTIDTPDNVRTIVGNNKIVGDTIQNFSANSYRRVDLTAQLAHGVDVRDAVAVLKDRIAKIPNVLAQPAPDVEILQFTLAGPVLAVRPYCNNTHYWQVYFDTNRVIRDAFASARYPVPEQHLRVQSPS